MKRKKFFWSVLIFSSSITALTEKELYFAANQLKISFEDLKKIAVYKRFKSIQSLIKYRNKQEDLKKLRYDIQNIGLAWSEVDLSEEGLPTIESIEKLIIKEYGILYQNIKISLPEKREPCTIWRVSSIENSAPILFLRISKYETCSYNLIFSQKKIYQAYSKLNNSIKKKMPEFIYPEKRFRFFDHRRKTYKTIDIFPAAKGLPLLYEKLNEKNGYMVGTSLGLFRFCEPNSKKM